MFQQTQKPGKSNKQDSDSEQKKSLLNNAEMSRGHEIAPMLGAPEHLRAEIKENQDPQKESKAAQLKANSENSNAITNGIVDLNSNNVAAQINAYALAHGDLHFARLHNNLSSKEGQKPAQMKEEEEEMTQAKKSGFDPVQFMIEGNKMLQAQIDRNNQSQKESKPGNSSAADNVGTTTNLPEDVNSQMERAFESSFANVKIHKNSEKATQLGALAYTQGNDLYFAPGQYNPSTVKGQELIGHELTHVVQQRAGKVKGSQNKGGVSVNTDKSLEKEADVMGENAAKGIQSDSSKVKNASKKLNKQKSVVNLQNQEKEPLSEKDKPATKHYVSITVPYIMGGIDNSIQALRHYFNGGGVPATLGNNTIDALIRSEGFQIRHRRIITGKTTSLTGNFSVNLTSKVFHVGRTNIDYSISCNGDNCIVTYDFFVRDGFWDPDFIDENTLGRIGVSSYVPDGPGPNLERFGGTPYSYVPVRGTATFPNPGY